MLRLLLLFSWVYYNFILNYRWKWLRHRQARTFLFERKKEISSSDRRSNPARRGENKQDQVIMHYDTLSMMYQCKNRKAHMIGRNPTSYVGVKTTPKNVRYFHNGRPRGRQRGAFISVLCLDGPRIIEVCFPRSSARQNSHTSAFYYTDS